MKRYSIQTNPDQRASMIKQIQTRRSVIVRRISSRKTIHLVELSPGEVVQAEYNRRYHKIMVVYSVVTLEGSYGAVAA